MTRRLRFGMGLFLVLVLVGAGCSSGEDNGDDDGSGSSSDSGSDSGEESERLDEDELADEINSACADILDAAGDLPEVAQGDNEAGAEVANIFADLFTGIIEDFEGITPPEDLEDDFDDLISIAEDTRSSFEDLGEAVADNDAEAAGEAQGEVDTLGQDFEDLAVDLGADDCAG